MSDPTGLALSISVWVLPVIFAITLHEAAHGFVAWRLGDPTAWLLGRVSANPLRHIDPMGTVILPALFLLTAGFAFGYAKPVPIDVRQLCNPRRDMALVAAAGPAANLLMALIAALLLWLVPLAPDILGRWLAQNCVNAILVNCVLAVFNMIPLPPLDGGRVAVSILPRALALPLAGVERYGFVILIGMVVLVPMISKELGHPMNPVFQVIAPVVDAIAQFLLLITGHG